MKKILVCFLCVFIFSCSHQQVNDDKKLEELKTKKEIESGLKHQTIEFVRDTIK